MTAITRGSNVALPNSSLARSAWIAITSTMCRRRIAKCSSVIGFIGKSLPVQGGRSGAEIGCLSLTGADLAHGRERHPEVLRHLNRLHTRQQRRPDRLPLRWHDLVALSVCPSSLRPLPTAWGQPPQSGRGILDNTLQFRPRSQFRVTRHSSL